MDVEHQPTDLVLGSPTFSLARRQVRDPDPVASQARLMLVSPRACRDGTEPQRPVAVHRGRAGGGITMRAHRVILRMVFWVILSVVLVAASFWVYAIVTGGKSF